MTAYTPIKTDGFNRANESPIAAPWTKVDASGTNITIASNAANVDNVASDKCWRYSATWPNNQYSQAKVSVTGTSGITGPGVSLRCSTSAETYYRIFIDKAASSNLQVRKIIAGSDTAIASATVTWTDGDTLRAVIEGSRIRVFQNGVLKITTNDTSIASGQPGLCYSSTVTSCSWDDWEGGTPDGAIVVKSIRPRPFAPGLAR